MIKNIKTEELKNEYKYRLELHAHTSPVSPCSQVPPEKLIDTFNSAGYDGIAVTNHFFPGCVKSCIEKDAYVEMYKRDFYAATLQGDKVGMRVYLGAELRFPNENNNDYLLFGYDLSQLGDIFDYLSSDLKTFVKEGKDENMFLLQAHPFRDGMVRMDPELLDAIEVFNMHPNHNSRISLASKFAAENGKRMTGGTDYHHPDHYGLSATRTRILPADTKELVEVLRSDDYAFEIGERFVI